MFDYARNMQLALTDRLRRAGLMAGAGAVLLIAAGFLLAALFMAGSAYNPFIYFRF